MKNSLKNKLKFDYENLHKAPSVGLWERLENELEGKKESTQKSFGWLKYAAVLLLMISFSALFFMKKNAVSEEQNLASQITSQTNKNIDSGISKTNTNFANDNASNVVHQEKIVKIEPTKIGQNSEKNITKTITESIALENKNPEIVNIQEEVIPQKKTENKEVLVENKTPKTNSKYVKSEDLLFGRELQKASLEQENTKSKMGNLDLKIKSPKTIEILGFTVYSEENEKK